MVGVLVFANWGKPDIDTGLWYSIYSSKWIITGLLSIGFAAVLVLWFEVPLWKMAISGAAVAVIGWFFPHDPLVPFTAGVIALSVMAVTSGGETEDWFNETWGFAKQILPLLFLGVLFAGLLLGRPDKEGLIPNAWIAWALGGNSVWSNAIASVAGAFMYFATLTEVPIVQGLIGSGMGKGPALALLLAGPALSLPSMLVINSIMGFKKTFVFVSPRLRVVNYCGNGFRGVRRLISRELPVTLVDSVKGTPRTKRERSFDTMVNNLPKTKSVKSKLVLKIAAALIFASVGAFLFATYGSREETLIDKLTQASAAGDIPQVLALLDQGVDLGARDSEGKTALGRAAFQGHKEMVELLLAQGLDANATGKYGKTALMAASSQGHPEVVKTLLANGAEVNAKDRVQSDRADVRLAQRPQGSGKAAFGMWGRRWRQDKKRI